MASNLLQKEEEYRKLNEELQNQNKKIMEEFDVVMKKQDYLLKESQNDTQFDYYKLGQRKSNKENAAKSCSDFVSKRIIFNLSSKENCENLQDDHKEDVISCIPDSVDQMGIRGMTRFYRAKIKAMQNEYSQLQLEQKNKCEEVKKVQKENLKLTEEKDKWFQAYNGNKTNMSKLEHQITTLNSKCQSKENENLMLKKEIEQLKKDLKSTILNVSGHEVRLIRALEENEKLKFALKTAKQEEKDLKDAHRKEITETVAVSKRLEKQKTELLTTFKKQLQLVDNLKKQKALLEASKLTQISENEFMRILDWKIE